MPKNNLKEVIKTLNNHSEYPALSLVKNDPTIPALISKLIKSKDFNSSINIRDPKTLDYFSASNNSIKDISDSISTRINDVGYIKDLFPDIELAEQILISSILSPKDMMSTNVIYKLDETIMSPELSARVIDEVRNYMEKNYKISELLPNILKETLFESGAYIEAILPESSVDELINNSSGTTISTESLIEKKLFNDDKLRIKNTGFLGTPYETVKRSIGVEAFSYKGTYDPFIRVDERTHLPKEYAELVEITDNIDVLKIPAILNHNTKTAVKSKLSMTVENFFDNKPDEEKGYTNDDITSMLYKETSGGEEPFLYVPNKAQTKRKSIGKPLILKLPTEAVVPVHTPGDPSDHIGYFVLIDEEGNPLSNLDNKEFIDGLTDTTADNNSLSSFLMQKVQRNLVGIDKNKRSIVEQQTSIYASIVEADLIDRLKKGIYNRKLALGKVEEVYRIMLARSLANKGTRVLFMPIEVVSYFANDYLPTGIGKSLMDSMKILTSLRAVLLFAKVMAMTKAAIARTIVNVELDPDDPDPQKTMEEVVHERLHYYLLLVDLKDVQKEK